MWLWVPQCVFIYENTIELWVMETENSLWLFSVSITYNSKIRELSDGNRVMKIELSFGQTTFLLWVPPFLSYELWKLRIELRKQLNQTTSKSLFGQQFFITQFPSLITHHSSLITQFFTPVWHHHPISITQYFSYYLWAHTCQSV